MDKIIAKHIEAHGGAEKWEQVKTMSVTGNLIAFSVEKSFSMIKTKSGHYYGNFYLGKYEITEAFNGTSGWIIDLWQDIAHPRKTNKVENNKFLQKADLCTPFFNYKEKGYKVELIGKENIEGVDVLALKLIRTNGKVETWYLDAKTYLEYKYEAQWGDFAWPSMGETFFDDFRTIDGIVIPFYVERIFGQRNRIMNIEKVTINEPVDMELFEMPQSEEIKKLNFLKGKWAMQADIWAPQGAWFRLDSTSSVFEFAGTNMLQENIQYERIFPQTKIINYTYNEPTKKYRIAIFDDFSSTINILEGGFNEDIFVADNAKISFGNGNNENETYTQYSIYNIKKDGFVIEIKQSTDKGKTWQPQDKLTYTRIKE